MPLAHHVDGVRPDVVADVVIETEHAVWTLMLCGEDLRHIEAESANGDFASQLIAATSWHAGTRGCYFGVLSSQPRHQDAGVALVERYFRSRDSLRASIGTRGATPSPTSAASGQFVGLILPRYCASANRLTS